MSNSSIPGPQPSQTEPIFIRRLGRLVSFATLAGEALSAAGVLVSLVLISYAVVMRYVFNSAPTWVDDTVGFILVGIVMFAAPATMRHGGHLAVDILTNQLGARGRRWTALWSTIAMAVVALMLIINGWDTVESSRLLGISTSGTVELPIYQLQLLLPLGGILMLLVALEALLRQVTGLPPLAQHGYGAAQGTEDEP